MKRAARNATAAATPNAKMSVYTRFGDKGKTSLYDGKTVSKASLRVEVYGSIDELNSVIGVVLSETKDKKIKDDLKQIQNDLFEIGAVLASLSKEKQDKLSGYLKKRVLEMEKIIDELDKKLPRLDHFILPQGSKTSAFLHLARTIGRRAERRVVELCEKEYVNSQILIFLNRISDLLFMFARLSNFKQKQKEIIWQKK